MVYCTMDVANESVDEREERGGRMLRIEWGNDLRELARKMFQRLDREGKVGAEELFARKDLVAAANRVQLGWLKLEAMYHDEGRRVWALRETATADEIAERIVREGRGGRWREAARWPLFRLLGRFGDAPGAYLARLGGEKSGGEVRRWRLAGRLARLYEDYQNYRPEMIGDWTKGKATGTDENTEWEAALWRELREAMGEETLWDAYRDLPRRVEAAAEKAGWRRVEIFGTSMLPPVQMAIFRELGEHLEVTLSLFNPAKGDWFELPRAGVLSDWAGSGEAAVRERPEDRVWEGEEVRHPLLSRNGIGARDTVAGALDLTGGNVPEDEEGAWLEGGDNDLGRLQREIGAGTDPGEEGGASGDGSIRILQTHGKMREAEVVREEILRAFDELEGLEPMDVQVQVAGLEGYAPYLEAVFGGGEVPFVLEGGTGAGPETARAFLQLLDAATGRFAAPELLALLRTGPVRRKLGLDEAELRTAERLVRESGIRWGADAAHHGEECGRAFPECSWEYGLERLLLGYAMGEESGVRSQESGVRSQELGVRGFDLAEGEEAVTEGALAAFARRLAELREAAKESRTAEEWRALLAREFERNLDTKGDGRGADAVRKALARLEELAVECGCGEEKIGFEVVKEQLKGQLGEVRVGANLEGNAMQINELRVGSSTPRRVQVVMGLESGQFPGGETRAAYDLLRSGEGRKGRMGDRNPTRESRAAFLESLLSARERLVLSYPAWSETDLAKKPAAGPLQELEDWLKRDEKRKGVRIIAHKLHGYSPEYFQGKEDLVSHSASDWAAAVVLEKQRHGGGTEGTVGTMGTMGTEEDVAGTGEGDGAAEWPEGEASVDVEDIIRFFRNPAKAHWESLGVYWRTEDEGAADSEAFELDKLQEYKLKAAGLEALRAAGAGASEEARTAAVKAAVEEVYERMEETGVAPLGREGIRKVEEVADAVAAMPTSKLKKPADWERETELLRTALWTESRLVPAEAEVEVDGHKIHVTGMLEVGESDGVQPMARCSSPKARVRMEMWVKHLLGVASGKVKRTCVAQVGKSSKKLDDWRAEELGVEEAKRQLRQWAGAYLAWRGRAAPFSPEASANFAEDKDAAKVLKAWQDDFEGGKDVYQMREFGRRGPMNREGFGELGKQLMGQLAKAPPGKATGASKKGNPKQGQSKGGKAR